MRYLTFLIASLLLSATSQAQSLVVADDFNDGTVDPMWTQTFDPFIFWDVVEGAGAFNYNGVTTPFGALDERYALSADVVGGLPADFQLDVEFSWNDQTGFGVGENAMVFVVRLTDNVDQDIASFTMNDVSTIDAGEFTLEGGTGTTFLAIPANSDARFSLIRDAADNISYVLDVTGGVSTSGTLGVSAGTVTKVEFYVSHTSLCGPCGPFLGELHVDDLKLFDGPLGGGPSLSVSGLVAGGLAQFDVTGATPAGDVFLALSRTGAGPTTTPFGDVDLSQPITVLPSVVADAAGDASISLNVPGGASGAQVWFQALDLAAGVFTNGLAETVL